MINNKIDTGLDASIEKIKVMMIVDKLNIDTTYTLKSGYTFQYYQDGNKDDWIKIQLEVGHFDTKAAAIERFDNEFKDSQTLLKERLLFVVDKDGSKVATAMLWFSHHLNMTIDRLHWIAVSPSHQGQRLTHAMLCELLKDYPLDKKLYLTSQTWSYRAISIYYRFGFIPYPFEDIKHYFKLSLEDIIAKDFENSNLEKAWKLIDENII